MPDGSIPVLPWQLQAFSPSMRAATCSMLPSHPGAAEVAEVLSVFRNVIAQDSDNSNRVKKC